MTYRRWALFTERHGKIHMLARFEKQPTPEQIAKMRLIAPGICALKEITVEVTNGEGL